MIPRVLHALNSAAQAASPSGSTPGALVVVALLACIAALVIGFLRLRTLTSEIASRGATVKQQTEALSSALEQVQRLRADLDEKGREAQELRRESGVQRKKNHAMQDDVKRLRASLKEETERRVAAQNTRPAFAQTPGPKPKQSAPLAAPEVEKPGRAVAAPVLPVAAEPPAARGGPGPSELALQAQIKTLEAELVRHKQFLGDERVSLSSAKDELKKLRKRSEDLRRIDIITKSKMEILEDKLRHLGRAHYEAISEVALLKGEVQPPRPREPVRQTSMFGLQEPEAKHDGDANETEDDFAPPAPHDAPSVAQQAYLL